MRFKAATILLSFFLHFSIFGDHYILLYIIFIALSFWNRTTKHITCETGYGIFKLRTLNKLWRACKNEMPKNTLIMPQKFHLYLRFWYLHLVDLTGFFVMSNCVGYHLMRTTWKAIHAKTSAQILREGEGVNDIQLILRSRSKRTGRKGSGFDEAWWKGTGEGEGLNLCDIYNVHIQHLEKISAWFFYLLKHF